MERFPVIDVRLTSDIGTDFVVSLEDTEQMGSKEKFWCKRRGTEERYLLKYPRASTGEDWAEKIAAELAGDAGLRLPHASVDLATHRGRTAVLVRDFLEEGERLIHGNELLWERDPDYPHEMRRVPQHTLASVFDALEARTVEVPHGLDLPDGVRTAVDLYSGYLVLDALIGNTDRHHENWGIVAKKGTDGVRMLSVAPTYDHGSSLGRELRDEKRQKIRTTADLRSDLAAYAMRARSAFFRTADAAGPLGTFDLLKVAAERAGSAVRAWVARVEAARRALPYDVLIDRVPPERMTIEAREFTSLLLEYNFNRICEAVDRP